MVAAPGFATAAAGTPALAIWLRSLGATVGRGVWTDSYWPPEPDLVTLGDGATVNRGCVVQTHLFHDRVMSIDTVTLEAGATLGPHSVILPAASIGANATVGPARSEEHTSELQSLMRNSYAVLCLKKKNNPTDTSTNLILQTEPTK